MIRFCNLRGDPVSLDVDMVSHAQPDGGNTLIVMHDGSTVIVQDSFEVVAELVSGVADDGDTRH